MFDKKMKVLLVVLLAVFMIFAEKAEEKTLAYRFFASVEEITEDGALTYAVQINRENVFLFPEGRQMPDPALQAQQIADQMNELFRKSTDPMMIKPYLADDEVVIRIGDTPIVTIEDALAERLENTTSGVAMEWIDNLHRVFTAEDVDLGRILMQRGIAVLERARASWYGGSFHGRRTANGETFDQNALTAAHKTLPFGTVVLVTNLANGRSVLVRINDRGPFSPDRHIDLSKRAAEDIGMIRSGTAAVRIEVLTAHSTIARR
jgi:rare lipoprotein A